jgi:hypothetical protein
MKVHTSAIRVLGQQPTAVMTTAAYRSISYGTHHPAVVRHRMLLFFGEFAYQIVCKNCEVYATGSYPRHQLMIADQKRDTVSNVECVRLRSATSLVHTRLLAEHLYIPDENRSFIKKVDFCQFRQKIVIFGIE